MNINEYSEAVGRTANTTVGRDLLICNIVLGLNGESREVVRELHSYDRVSGNRTMLVKEIGDLLWYTVWAFREFDYNLELDFTTALALAKQRYRGNLYEDFDECLLCITEHVKKVVFHGLPIDHMHLRLNLGLLVLNIVLAATQHGITMDEVMEANIAKLRARYPEGYNPKVYANGNNG